MPDTTIVHLNKRNNLLEPRERMEKYGYPCGYPHSRAFIPLNSLLSGVIHTMGLIIAFYVTQSTCQRLMRGVGWRAPEILSSTLIKSRLIYSITSIALITLGQRCWPGHKHVFARDNFVQMVTAAVVESLILYTYCSLGSLFSSLTGIAPLSRFPSLAKHGFKIFLAAQCANATWLEYYIKMTIVSAAREQNVGRPFTDTPLWYDGLNTFLFPHQRIRKDHADHSLDFYIPAGDHIEQSFFSPIPVRKGDLPTHVAVRQNLLDYLEELLRLAKKTLEDEEFERYFDHKNGDGYSLRDIALKARNLVAVDRILRKYEPKQKPQPTPTPSHSDARHALLGSDTSS